MFGNSSKKMCPEGEDRLEVEYKTPLSAYGCASAVLTAATVGVYFVVFVIAQILWSSYACGKCGLLRVREVWDPNSEFTKFETGVLIAKSIIEA